MSCRFEQQSVVANARFLPCIVRNEPAQSSLLSKGLVIDSQIRGVSLSGWGGVWCMRMLQCSCLCPTHHEWN